MQDSNFFTSPSPKLMMQLSSVISNDLLVNSERKSSKLMEREFNIECLDEHNRLRSLHGVEPLLYSEKLAKSAQTFAEKLANSDRLEHSNAEEYGETLVSRYCTRECTMTGKQAALVWYSEIENYDFHCENQLSCGNFSQVVWKSTKEAGFGIAKTQDGHRIYVVGHYYPPGNYTNEWVDNVRPPLEGRIHVPSKEELGLDNLCSDMNSENVPNLKVAGDSESFTSDFKEANDMFIESPSDKEMDRFNSSPRIILDNCSSTTDNEIDEKAVSKTSNSIGESVVMNLVRVLDEAVEKQETNSIQLSDEKEKRLLWTRRQNGVAKSKSGVKIKFVRTTKRFFNFDGNELIKDVVHFKDLKTDKEFELDGKFTVKFTEPEKLVFEDLEQFRQDVYELHNMYRQYHNAKPLILDQELCELAQKWATKMLKEGKPSYPNEKWNEVPLGENVSYRSTYFDHLPANDLMKVWENEAKNYDYNSETNDISQSGHFTQVIWKDTQLIGIGRARCSNLNKTYVVIFYYPPGNVVGRYRENLEPRRV